ncbi:MAG: ABC transporter permease [Bacillota bacterium]|nr:ABC transporter permease [Bacillota bacterium]
MSLGQSPPPAPSPQGHRGLRARWSPRAVWASARAHLSPGAVWASLRAGWMRLVFGVSTAVDGLASHRLRSAITMVGVTIGVASVVSLVAIGEGARLVIVRQFQSLGTNLIKIESHHYRAVLRPEDAVELEARVPTISVAMPVVKADADIKWRRVRTQVKLLGVTEDFPYLREHPMAAGHFFTHLHVENRLRVAVVGYNLVTDLFQGRNPLGQRLYIGNNRFTVIGVLAPKGAGMADDIDNKIIIPVTAAQRLTRQYRVNEIWCKAVNKDTVDAAVAQISRIFRKKFGITDEQPAEGEEGPGQSGMSVVMKGGRVVIGRPVSPYAPPVRQEGPRPPGMPGEEPDQPQEIPPTAMLSVTSLNELVQEASKANRVMTLMLGAIAGVSLLVGGLGIMNIMLVSVTERTAEIGLRKALGARRTDLILQFLLEAFLISVVGGLVGVAGGWLGTGVIQRYGIETAMTWTGSWAALGAALLVGLIFGVYPAYQASGLSPAEALRK